MEASPDDKKWADFLFEFLLTYSNKGINAAHCMTPKQARLGKNRMQVKANLEMNRISKRKYPELSVNDNVKLYKKKTSFDKENKSVWLPTTHKIVLITYSFGQKYYHIDGYKQSFLRHELLLVK